MTDTNDPIVALGRQIAELEERYIELEGKESDARNAGDASKCYFETARLDVHDRICALNDALSCFEAQSLNGALIQLGRARCVIASDETVAKSAQSQIERLLMSAIRCIERELGTGLDEMGLGIMRSSHMDPWTPVEERLAAIKANTEPKAA